MTSLASKLSTLVFVLACALGGAAAPASALMVKLGHGRYANFTPLLGSRAPRTARAFDAAFSNLDYGGGPVMPANTNYTIVWQPSNYAGTAFQSGYAAGVNQFFGDLAAASGRADVSDAVSTQYNDVNGNTAAFASRYGGTFTDTDPLPANGCPVAGSGHICISDAQIQSELDTFLSAHGLPHDLTHEYFLLTPPGVASCFDSGGSECSINADQNQAYCAYHSATADGFIYANIPDFAGDVGCDPFVTQCPDTSCAYPNGTASDAVISAISHEHNESTTDPYPNSAWTDLQPGCGASSPMTCGGEIGDKCNSDAFGDPAIQLQDDGAGHDTPYNETINGRHYLLQREWSNQANQCLDSFTPGAAVAGAAFTDTPASGTTVSFDASASSATGGVAEYVWQFNDGPGGSQNYTVETSSPTIQHTFPSTGRYDVALTVMAADGTSSGTAATLDVGGAASPAARFSAFGASTPGSVMTFDASASSDPNAGGAITSYTWNFGDGTSTSGSTATASHTFSQAGSYLVTLTVTDAAGLSNTVAQTVSFGSLAPSASFSVTPGAALTGAPVSFDGSASTAPEGLAAYRWSFGDGATVSGTSATASHAYAAPGTYTVALTVTDSYGHSASARHTVTITAAGPPTAAFTAPSSGLPGQVLSFDGRSSTDPASHIVNYIWYFGDGQVGTGSTTSHAFAAGTYTVTLTVYDAFGQSASVSHQVHIGAPAPLCVVPRLRGLSRSRAAAALAAGHCRTGVVHVPRHKPHAHLARHRRWALVVRSSALGAGTRAAAGTRVGLTLVWRSVRG
ncbi:MAG TPA: PKD domain-containing protein [Solirubrobacteraceae bacterium]|nr:PKD domain-containing protein [Solirubrobacteraceae bacterium]